MSQHQVENVRWHGFTRRVMHVCNADCVYRELDPSSGLHVCAISGRWAAAANAMGLAQCYQQPTQHSYMPFHACRCFGSMLTEREEHAGEWERGRSRHSRGDEGDEGWGAEEGMGGRLGRAFYAGYNAESPAELRRIGLRF
mgnify:CR=1 FL=1